MPFSPRRRAAPGLALAALSLLLAACGSSSQSNTSREVLRFNPTLPPAYLEDRYDYALVADGGQRPYRYTLNGALPKGLVYSSGRISGTPTEKGSYELNATVEDGNLSSRAVKLTLTVSDTPPPQFDQFVPNSEQDSPFVYGLRVRARESRGFQMQVPLTDLRPTLDTLKAAEGVLYVVRYNQERNVMDIDVAFTQPRTNFEAYRLSIAPLPDKKVRFAAGSVLMALYDKNGKLVTNFQPIERQATEGRYKYEDLQTLARNWGKGTTPQAPAAPTTPATPPAQAPADQPNQTQPPTPPSAEATAPAERQAAPATPEPAPQTEQPAQPAQPEQTQPAQPTQPAQGQPTQPAQGQPTQPAQSQPAPPAQNQPAQPAQEQPAQTPSAQAEQPQPAQTPRADQTPATQPAPASQAAPAPAQADTPAQTQPTSPSGQPSAGQAAGERLEGDFNGDGKVDQKDLEALRASYAWANVGNPTPRPSQPSQNQPNQNQPNQNQPNPQNQPNQNQPNQANPPGGTGGAGSGSTGTTPP